MPELREDERALSLGTFIAAKTWFAGNCGARLEKPQAFP
jgi:hypothetical protein